MLDEFGAEIEHADSRLDSTMKKMAKVLHLSNGNLYFSKSKPVLLIWNDLFVDQDPISNHSVSGGSFVCASSAGYESIGQKKTLW
jgi:hypothetical protein